MLGKLRAIYEKRIAPIGMVLARAGFSPNVMTLLSLFIAILSGYLYSIHLPLWGSVAIVLTGVFDMFDGAIARALGKTTRFGATLDHVIDRYAEFFVLFGIVNGGYTTWVWGSFTLFGMLMASFTRAKAESVGGLQSCSVGIAERQEKLIIIIVGTILILVMNDALTYAVILVGILSHITVVQRLRYTWIKTGGE